MIPVPGIRPVLELLHHNSSLIKEVWIARQRNLSRLEEIISICDRQGIPVYYKDAMEISCLIPEVNHQGIVAIISRFKYSSLEELISHVNKIPRKSLILALDHITDEGNLASILRSAAFFDVQGIILPKNRSASISPQVIKRSAGACLCLSIVRVKNMVSALKKLVKEGFWIIGTSHKGRISLYDFDWDRSLVLVLGNEQKGIGRATEKICHEIIKIPLLGKVESLNVGVATGVFLSEITRYRLKSS